jgi:ABC-type proline/glycine betaine transport system ATPase subunit
MLTGLIQPSSGDAKVLGNSLIKDIDKIRKTMGVCPQFDILWNELTAAEHIRLFAALKGLSTSETEIQVNERLKVHHSYCSLFITPLKGCRIDICHELTKWIIQRWYEEKTLCCNW